jgi:hypothetical protein
MTAPNFKKVKRTTRNITHIYVLTGKAGVPSVPVSRIFV